MRAPTRCPERPAGDQDAAAQADSRDGAVVDGTIQRPCVDLQKRRDSGAVHDLTVRGARLGHAMDLNDT